MPARPSVRVHFPEPKMHWALVVLCWLVVGSACPPLSNDIPSVSILASGNPLQSLSHLSAEVHPGFNIVTGSPVAQVLNNGIYDTDACRTQTVGTKLYRIPSNLNE